MELILTILFFAIALKAVFRIIIFAANGYPRTTEETARAAAFAVIEGIAWCAWIAWTIWA